MTTITVNQFHLIGIAVRTTNEQNQAANDIPMLWDRFFKEDVLNQIPNKVCTAVYSLYTNYEGDHTMPYTTIIGCEVADLSVIPKGMVGQTFEADKYQKITVKGDLTQGLIINEWEKIWSENWDRKYTADFEVYDEKANNPHDAEVSIYVAIK
ncbi:AraC family transcriptional regulator [Myroides marinus]|uniref:Predicted transcriptional regulator YdeE, contains AraC-type DNA-binding domain n=1 Tax=Myroides marinus TaxID=703342 RepID=A0A1H6X699_9FLAO|nr:GyrI-like domain-containing protein [Myroides marinus]KUF44220.1 transcriptional regulator [Myroides marinus]MDM1372896.1 AraC family transcriptional regulator [Myroides marinus]MDM1374865.1 AraC family transcriptional regulator [Myroides marinus]MDM1380215.1 AraC family transcriptional regulator [Myroides marinus]MDM1387487.1 AraC family transcriptional regulator [Myroides marinus]